MYTRKQRGYFTKTEQGNSLRCVILAATREELLVLLRMSVEQPIDETIRPNLTVLLSVTISTVVLVALITLGCYKRRSCHAKRPTTVPIQHEYGLSASEVVQIQSDYLSKTMPLGHINKLGNQHKELGLGTERIQTSSDRVGRRSESCNPASCLEYGAVKGEYSHQHIMFMTVPRGYPQMHPGRCDARSIVVETATEFVAGVRVNVHHDILYKV